MTYKMLHYNKYYNSIVRTYIGCIFLLYNQYICDLYKWIKLKYNYKKKNIIYNFQ